MTQPNVDVLMENAQAARQPIQRMALEIRGLSQNALPENDVTFQSLQEEVRTGFREYAETAQALGIDVTGELSRI